MLQTTQSTLYLLIKMAAEDRKGSVLFLKSLNLRGNRTSFSTTLFQVPLVRIRLLWHLFSFSSKHNPFILLPCSSQLPLVLLCSVCHTTSIYELPTISTCCSNWSGLWKSHITIMYAVELRWHVWVLCSFQSCRKQMTRLRSRESAKTLRMWLSTVLFYQDVSDILKA